MQRHEMIEALGHLGLKGMAQAYDEAVVTGVQRNRTAVEILADLLKAETAHRQAASIRYRLTAAKLPVMKDLAAFVFEGSPINQGLVRSLHDGAFLPNHRNIVWSAGPARARPTWPSPSPPTSCAPALGAATSTPSIWSTS